MGHTETGPRGSSNGQASDEISIGDDRDALAYLFLTSPATGKRLRITSDVEDANGESTFEVGTMDDRWKVTVRMEQT